MDTRSHLNASDDNELRTKIAMVVFALESAIGKRLTEHERVDPEEISETYIAEVIDKAIDVSSGTSDERYYNRIKHLFDQLNIGEVRNSACHPNRHISDNHWHRIAALATDPVINNLGLSSVTEALISAHEGNLKCPPDHWYGIDKDVIVNNIPQNYEHRITGFIGRRSDLSEISKSILNRRISSLCIVGRGGLGKTALAVDLLESLAGDPSNTEWLAGIIFITAKKEELTPDGVKILDNDATLDAIKDQLQNAAEELYLEPYLDPTFDPESTNILLCIDNLESVLAEDEDAYAKICDIIPPWVKLLMTSRVPVDGATNHVLKDMKEGEARGLAQKYYSRVIGHEPTGELAAKIAKQSLCNPLAIKLSVDCLARGDDEDKALASAVSDVVEYSYGNLLSRLSDLHIEVLETLFCSGRPLKRTEICGILEQVLDNVAPVILDLSKTSLITRSDMDNGEGYILSDAVRPLVRSNHKHLQTRKKIQRNLRKRKDAVRFHELQQTEYSMDEQSEDYVSSTHPEDLKHLLISAVRCLRSPKSKGTTDRIVEVSGNFYRVENEYQSNSDFLFFQARLLRRLGDYSEALALFQKSHTINPDKIWVTINIGEMSLEMGDMESFDQAIAIFDEAKSAVSKEVQPYTRIRYWDTLYRCIAKSNKHSELNRRTEEQINCEEDDDSCMVIHHAYHALGIAYEYRTRHSTNPSETRKSLFKAYKILSSAKHKYGTSISLSMCYKEVTRDTVHYFRTHGNLDKDDDFFLLKNIDSYFLSELEVSSSDSSRHRGWILKSASELSKIDCELGNPFKLEIWKSLLVHHNTPKPTIEELTLMHEQGLSPVWVYSDRKWSSGYMFGTPYGGDNTQTIFIHRARIDDEAEAWSALRAEKIAVGKVTEEQPGKQKLESGTTLSNWRSKQQIK